MPKKTVYFITIFFISFVSFSCSPFFESNFDTGSVVFTIDEATTRQILGEAHLCNMSRTAVGTDENGMLINIDIKGDYTAVQTSAVTNQGVVISFPEIPVKSNIYAEATIYRNLAGDTRQILFTGRSNTIKVKKGSNQLNLPLTATPLTFTVVFDVTTNWSENTATNITRTVSNNTTTTAPAYNGERLRYVFKGWYTTATPGVNDTPFDFTTRIIRDTTLYAVWETDTRLENFVLVEGATITDAVADSEVFISGRTVKIGDLWVCDHEVTQGEYQTIMGVSQEDLISAATNGLNKGINSNYPVYYINWYSAIVYCNKRSIAENLTPCYSINGSTNPAYWGTIPTADNYTWNSISCNWAANGYRLPTEAEWEYAARGGNGLTGTQYAYSGSDSVGEVAWYSGNNDSDTMHEVKTDKVQNVSSANILGIYDMSGNVFEWCWDKWTADITDETPITGSVLGTDPQYPNNHVRRGGGFDSADSVCTVALRSHGTTFYPSYYAGFRVVRTATPIPEMVTYNVTFNSNGGSQVATQSVQTGSHAVQPDVPKKDLLNFGGWYTDSGCTNQFNFTTPITGSITLYAKWNSDFIFVEGATVTSAVANSGIFNGSSITIGNLWVCDHEVTQKEFEAIMGTNPSQFNGSTGKEPATGETQTNRPVESVTWYEAITYCNKRSLAENLTPCYSVSGITDWRNLASNTIPAVNDATWNAVSFDASADGYRLPTEAEWEYVGRGGNGLTGTQYTYSGNDSIDVVAWHSGNSTVNGSVATHEVKIDKTQDVNSANGLGIYDMTGNVWEWCWDLSGTDRCIRGGACDNNVYNNQNALPVYFRYSYPPYDRNTNGIVGFRVVRNAQ